MTEIGEAETGVFGEPRAWGELRDWVIWELGENDVIVYATRAGLARETKGHLQCSVRDLRVLATLLPAFIAEYDARIAARIEEDDWDDNHSQLDASQP